MVASQICRSVVATAQEFRVILFVFQVHFVRHRSVFLFFSACSQALASGSSIPLCCASVAILCWDSNAQIWSLVLEGKGSEAGHYGLAPAGILQRGVSAAPDGAIG